MSYGEGWIGGYPIGVRYETPSAALPEGQVPDEGGSTAGTAEHGAATARAAGVPVREAQQHDLAPDQQASIDEHQR